MKIVLMGVSGSGKSLVGRALARMLGWSMIEGDDLHPPGNVEKMSRGVPLTDEDRWPWLDALRDAMSQHKRVVVTCSALRRSYRERLRHGDDDMRFIYLYTSRQTLAGRLAQRRGHFFSPRLLDNQLATLEPPAADEAIITIETDASAAVLARRIMEMLQVS